MVCWVGRFARDEAEVVDLAPEVVSLLRAQSGLVAIDFAAGGFEVTNLLDVFWFEPLQYTNVPDFFIRWSVWLFSRHGRDVGCANV